MKYIDADKLKELIDEKWKELAVKNVKVGGGKWDAEISTYLSVLRLIASLQQEQPEVDLVKEMDKFYGMYRDKTGETHDIEDDEPCFDWKEDELSEHEMRIARHFAEWGAIHLNTRKEINLEKLGGIARHLIAVKDHEEDMRLDEGEWLLLERIGYPERFNTRKED